VLAEADLTTATQLAGDSPDASFLTEYAWILATPPSAQIRNGPGALQMATKAADLTEYKNAKLLDTQAVVYAETANSTQQIKWQEQAGALHQAYRPLSPKAVQGLNDFLALYKEHQPYHESQLAH
jgi:hypothetical protein